MNYFRCTVGGSGKGNTVTVTCAEEFAGLTITLSKTGKTYTKTCPSTAPYVVTFYGVENGTYTVSCTVDGQTYSETVIVQDVSCVLNYGFKWQTWVDTASQLYSSDYASLSEVLADEEAVRELFLEHACVDYMAELTSSNEDLETVINDDYCAKWINNCDYALDFLGANTVIKALMDEADKYGYGEWTLMPQVPTMTSNTVPYGQAYRVSGTVQKEAWYAFNGNESDACEIGDTGNWEIGYKFINPICIKRIYLHTRNAANYGTKTILVRASNDNLNWDVLATIETTNNTKYYVDLSNNNEYLYYEIFNDNAYNAGAIEIQFYAWAPKGNIPIMTANNAPYGEVFGDAIYSSNYLWYAFDGNEESQTESSTTAVPWNIGYKSVNPICVKRFRIRHRSGGTNQLGYNTAFTLQGSNDGTNWDDLGSYTNDSAGNIQFLEVENNNSYYIYHRVHMTAGAGGGNGAKSIQFYGRELKVSVPTMTSNTAPYGEAFASSIYSSSYPAWKAFDGVENNTEDRWAGASDSTNNQLGYRFTNPVVVKHVYVKTVGEQNLSAQIQGSNDGSTWVDVGNSFTINAQSTKYQEIENDTAYKYYQADLTYLSGNYPGNTITSLQFYGLDYSEKEFEAGTTKKWLYDHGVELETLTITGTKYDDCVQLTATSQVLQKVGIDTSNNNLLRGKVGAHGSGTVSLFCDNSYSQFTANNMPNNNALDISSMNGTHNVAFSMAANGVFDCTELWLE